MERAPPALAADDHPPSPPPPPTPAPASEPPTPADHPTPAEHPSPQPDSPPPIPPSRPIRRSARIRGDSDRSDDRVPEPSPDLRDSPDRKQLKRVSKDDATADPENHAADVDHEAQPEQNPQTTSMPEVDNDKSHNDNLDDADAGPSPENDPTSRGSESDREDDQAPESEVPAESDRKSTSLPREDSPAVEKPSDAGDYGAPSPEADATMNEMENEDLMAKKTSRDGEVLEDEHENPEEDEVAKDVSAGANDVDKDDEGEGAERSAALGEPTDEVPTDVHEDPIQTTTEKPTEAEDAMEIDQLGQNSEEMKRRDDSAMEVERPDEGEEAAEEPMELLETVKSAESTGKNIRPGESPPTITDSDDEIGQNQSEAVKPPSPLPFSPPRTRRRLATRTPSSPESPPARSKEPIVTPKTAPHKSSRRSESSEDVMPIEKAAFSRYETRSSTRGPSPVRTRRRRHSEPAPVTVPVAKSRARRTKKYSRKPVKGDRLRVLWHIDNIYYEGVVDSVLAFRGKRFYDITYDSGEREYYLELTHRKWRFADGRDGDYEDEEEEEQHPVQRDIDYSKYPQIGDRILVMWHVDGKYYPGKVNDILKANGAWFYDVDYEGGDREFFLDLTIRKWKYPETSEEPAKHPLVDRKIPKPQPKPKPKPAKVKPKPKPKRVARKTIGPGSSAFAAGGSPSQSPPRTSRRQRTLEMLLDDREGAADHITQQGEPVPETSITGRGETLDVLDGASKLHDDELGPANGLENQRDLGIPDLVDAGKEQDGGSFPFDSFGGNSMGVLDEMEPPLPSQTVLKKPRGVDASNVPGPEEAKDIDDVSDIFSLLRKPALQTSGSLHDPQRPPSPPKSQPPAEKRRESLPQGVKPPSPVSRPTSRLRKLLEQPSSGTPVQSGLKRKLAKQPFPVPIPKRPASVPRNEPKPTPPPAQRRLKKVKPRSEEQEGNKEEGGTGSDPNVADIVSVAGIVAKKWAREEVGKISDGINKLKRQISSLKTLHSKSLSNIRQKQQVPDKHADILPEEEAERQINNLGTNVVALVRRYRDTVEKREKKLKIQFTRMRTKITEQNEGLMETADVLSQLDIFGLEALKGLQPKTRKKLEIPPPLPPRQTSQAYTQPPTYALSSGVPMQQYQAPPGAPGSLGQHNDAIVRNLRRRLADLVTRSEWLGDEVKRLQGREKTLFREKATALAELRKAKHTPAVVDLTANGRGKGRITSSRASLPATKPGPTKPVGITKRRTRGTVVTPTPPTPPSKGSGKALRKTLPRSNSKYKAPPPEPQQPDLRTPVGPVNKTAAKFVLSRTPVTTQLSSSVPVSQPGTVPTTSPAEGSGADDTKTRSVPSDLQLQMDKQASDLISLTFTVWLLQDESRSEPPKGPGELMDAWVRGCTKKCLNSALTFLTTSGGIFRARSNLKADVDNENIYTDWIMAVPTDDGAIERARANYSLWDPSLRDSEWQAEKRVLRGLTICYQKALALTPAASFTATLMYAKAILNKAIADFETFMPATITLLPGKRIAPPPIGSSSTVARPKKAALPAQPKPSNVALPEGQRGTQSSAPVSKPDQVDKPRSNEKVPTLSKTAPGVKPVSAGTTASDHVLGDPKSRGENGSGKAAAAPSVPSASKELRPQVPDPLKLPTPGGQPQVRQSVAGEDAGEDQGNAQQAVSNSQTVPTSKPGARASDSNSSEPLKTLQSKSPASVPAPAAADPTSSRTPQHDLKETTPGRLPSQNAPVPVAKQTSAPLEQLGASGIKRPAGQVPTPEDSVKVTTAEKVTPSSDPSLVGAARADTPGQKALEPGSAATTLKSGIQNSAEHSSSGPHSEKSAGQGTDVQDRNGKPNKRISQATGKGVKGSMSKILKEPRSTRTVTAEAADTPTPAARLELEPNPRGGASATQAANTKIQPAFTPSRNGGLSLTKPQSHTRGLRSASRAQPRAQSRGQKKSGSYSQSKASRTQESREPVHQADLDVPVTQGMASLPTARLQEVPRRHMTLGAPRAPLELPRVNLTPGQGGNVGASGTSGGTSTQRTYPMLSRNQIRVGGSAIPAAATLSRNQVVAGKRPQVGTAQMSVPAAPQRRVAPGMQPSGTYGSSDAGDHMEIDAGRDGNRRRGDIGVAEQQDLEVGRGIAVGNDIGPPVHPQTTGFPDDSDNPAGAYASNPSLNVIGRQSNLGNVFQTTGKKQIGFKSLPMGPPRQASHTGATADGQAVLSHHGAHDRAQNSYEVQRPVGGPTDCVRTTEGQAPDYGQGGEHVYSPYNASGQDRDLPGDLMNPPTPSSFAGLDGYGISLNTDQVPLQRDSLPATPSDFDRYGVQSPINLERQSSWGTQQQNHGLIQGQIQGQGQLGQGQLGQGQLGQGQLGQGQLGQGQQGQGQQGQGQQGQGQGQGQGQLGHIMNPQRRDGVYNQTPRYQTRSSFQGRRQ